MTELSSVMRTGRRSVAGCARALDAFGAWRPRHPSDAPTARGVGWARSAWRRVTCGAQSTRAGTRTSRSTRRSRSAPSTTRWPTSPSASASARGGRPAPRSRAAATPASSPPPGGRDPIEVLETQAATRVPELVPLRYGRMAASPFAFYRGAAASWPRTWPARRAPGSRCRPAGTPTWSTSALYFSPERRLVFDINDFDETLPGPWEWDVKRLAALDGRRGRANGFSAKESAADRAADGAGYRNAMRQFVDDAQPGHLVRQARRRCRSSADVSPTRSTAGRMKLADGSPGQGAEPRQRAGVRQADPPGRRRAAVRRRCRRWSCRSRSSFPEAGGRD